MNLFRYHWPSRKRAMERLLAAKTWHEGKPPLHANQGSGKAVPCERKLTAAEESFLRLEIERSGKEQR